MAEVDWFGEDDLPQRVAPGGVGGYRADTDDVVGELELGEEEINPDALSKKRRGEVGGGPVGMMPPVGMAQGAGVAGARGAAAGVGNTGMVPSGGVVGSGGLGAAGVAGSGVAGAGGAAGAGSGLSGLGAGGGSGLGGAGVGTVAAGSSGADYGFGINPVTGRVWSVSDPGFAERFGTVDPRTGRYVNPVTGVVYDPTTGRWIHPGAGQGGVAVAGAGGDPGPGFGGTSRGVGGVLGSGHTVAAGDGTSLGGVPGGVAGIGGGGALGGGGATSGAGGVPGPGSGWGGGEYDTGDMATSSKRWDELTERMNTVKSKIDGLTGQALFGLVAHTQGTYGGAVRIASQNAQDSGANMTSTATDLAGSAGDYEATEQENTALGVKVVGK